MSQTNPNELPPSNPYAAPTASNVMPPVSGAYSGPMGTGSVWRMGRLLVMEKWATLPPVCIKTGEPTDRVLKQRMTWHSPLYYLLVLASPLIYLVVALVIRKTATVHIPLARHRITRRRLWIATGFLGFFASVGLFVFGLSLMDLHNETAGSITLLIAILVFLLSLVVPSFASRVASPAKITEHLVVIRGASPEYLSGLPEWPYRPF